jgi:hypothetical protein
LLQDFIASRKQREIRLIVNIITSIRLRPTFWR